MNIKDRADEEAERLEESLANGEITETQYKRYIKDLAEELREYERNY